MIKRAHFRDLSPSLTPPLFSARIPKLISSTEHTFEPGELGWTLFGSGRNQTFTTVKRGGQFSSFRDWKPDAWRARATERTHRDDENAVLSTAKPTLGETGPYALPSCICPKPAWGNFPTRGLSADITEYEKVTSSHGSLSRSLNVLGGHTGKLRYTNASSLWKLLSNYVSDPWPPPSSSLASSSFVLNTCVATPNVQEFRQQSPSGRYLLSESPGRGELCH